jgi:hypothetical protein
MIVEIGIEAAQIIFWEYLFKIFGIVSSQCVIPIPLLATHLSSQLSNSLAYCTVYSHPSLLLTVHIAIHLSCLPYV